jgi:hypothetical protein
MSIVGRKVSLTASRRRCPAPLNWLSAAWSPGRHEGRASDGCWIAGLESRITGKTDGVIGAGFVLLRIWAGAGRWTQHLRGCTNQVPRQGVLMTSKNIIQVGRCS